MEVDYIYIVDTAPDLAQLEVRLNDLAGENFRPLQVFPVPVPMTGHSFVIVAYRPLRELEAVS